MKRFKHMHPRLAAILVDGLTVILMLLAWLLLLGIGLHVWAAPAPAEFRVRDGVHTPAFTALTTIDRDELADMRAAEDWTEPETHRFTDHERDLLARVMMCEAGNQGPIGAALVGRVILNRVESESGRFPNDIESVIYQPGQFSTASYLYRYEPNADCYAALDLLEAGWDESQGALFFESGAGFSWATFLFQYGGHRFYTV